ncbi:hypothetical protein SAMN00777080_3628 [Aquiflexum balticum DSM 16537]|uniref:DUF3108 domain-containing protein n=1 Tax=Aquiflexum balticum DSM 16537 TaxID=758820 RepID=A0A1W2H7V3_9BACT|nr:DUF6134 family protein [Aquiflexum balticum]SMD44990.1 hypothetical protein SAMN00777080_3628 [Aquiflexum balticum DSM 16537]
MKRHLNRFVSICLISFFFQPSSVNGQEVVNFDISVAGISIGEMSAIKTTTGNEIKYQINSLVSFWFFGKISVDYKSNTIYKNKQLYSAISSTNSKRGDFSSSIQWNKDHYKVDAKTYKFENNSPIKKPFFFSSAMLFFEEPKMVKEFLAENFGLPSPVTKVKDYYEVDVNGHKNRYYYIGGKLDKAIIYNPVKNYMIKRK